MSESPREPKSLELRPRNCRWLTGEENWLTSLLRGENSDGEAAATAGDGVEASTGARRMATGVDVLVLRRHKQVFCMTAKRFEIHNLQCA